VLVLLGLAVMLFQGDLAHLAAPGLKLPAFTTFTAGEVWQTLLLAGFAQVPLTATNAVISTSHLITSYWPEEHVSLRRLSLSHGVMNIIAPFFGGMPMCHGSGGLAGQYFFGARTAGTNLIEGAIEVVLGLFFAGSIAALFVAFPKAIIGAMMFMVGIELMKFARHVKPGRELVVLAVTVGIALLTNMAYGFLGGIAVHTILARIPSRGAGHGS